MVEPQPGRQAEVQALVQACSGNLRPPDAAELRRAFTPPAQGDSGATTAEQVETVYATACQLCDEGNFRFAVALALHLVAQKPDDPRFNFMAGTCMQRLGLHGNAGRYFCVALVQGGDNPAALYRLGECLLAIGDRANAAKALEAAMDVCRDVDGAHEVQLHAQNLIESLKAGSRGHRRRI
jgi:Flp pilus assembly protein TadD